MGKSMKSAGFAFSMELSSCILDKMISWNCFKGFEVSDFASLFHFFFLKKKKRVYSVLKDLCSQNLVEMIKQYQRALKFVFIIIICVCVCVMFIFYTSRVLVATLCVW
eukprot:Rmarinus@m.30212